MGGIGVLLIVASFAHLSFGAYVGVKPALQAVYQAADIVQPTFQNNSAQLSRLLALCENPNGTINVREENKEIPHLLEAIEAPVNALDNALDFLVKCIEGSKNNTNTALTNIYFTDEFVDQFAGYFEQVSSAIKSGVAILQQLVAITDVTAENSVDDDDFERLPKTTAATIVKDAAKLSKLLTTISFYMQLSSALLVKNEQTTTDPNKTLFLHLTNAGVGTANEIVTYFSSELTKFIGEINIIPVNQHEVKINLDDLFDHLDQLLSEISLAYKIFLGAIQDYKILFKAI